MGYEPNALPLRQFAEAETPVCVSESILTTEFPDFFIDLFVCLLRSSHPVAEEMGKFVVSIIQRPPS